MELPVADEPQASEDPSETDELLHNVAEMNHLADSEVVPRPDQWDQHGPIQQIPAAPPPTPIVVNVEGLEIVLPQSLTPNGRVQYFRAANKMLKGLTAEINLQTSVASLDTAQQAETTAADVERGYSSWINRQLATVYPDAVQGLMDGQRAYLENNRHAALGRRRRRANWGLLASLLVTLVALGIEVLPSSPGATWQWVAMSSLLTFGLCGAIASLAARWDSGPDKE
jgi:hypothetical protein